MSTAATIAKPVDAWLPQGEVSRQLNAPEWLADVQAEALAEYKDIGLPGVRDEQWRYTNLRAFKNAELSFSTAAITELPAASTGTRLVFVNGHYQAGLSQVGELPTGVYVGNLAGAFEDHGELIQSRYGASLPEQAHGFQQMNSALHSDGYAVILPNAAVVEEPIEVIFTHTDGAAGHARNVIMGCNNSQCTVIERHISNGAEQAVYLNNTITEIFAGRGCHVDHTKLQMESSASFHFGGVTINQERDSNVAVHSFALDGNLIRNDVIANLNGEGGHSEMNGLVLGADKMHVDNHTEVNHAVPHCTSDEYYKTILDDESRSVFRGRIIVAQDAQQTNADQQNNNLLLSERAEADSKPQLEIYADDVKCSHGATVGQLDAKSLFYLQSRGINLDAARALLTFAFANEVVDRIKVESIRQEITQRIAGELVTDLEDVL